MSDFKILRQMALDAIVGHGVPFAELDRYYANGLAVETGNQWTAPVPRWDMTKFANWPTSDIVLFYLNLLRADNAPNPRR